MAFNFWNCNGFIASLAGFYNSGVFVGCVSLASACSAAGASGGASAGEASEVRSAAGSTTTNRMISQI